MAILIKGRGDTFYRSHRSFARLPEGRTFGQMRAVATDSLGRVYVGHRPLLYGNLPPVAIFEPDGTYAGGWGAGVFQGIHNIHITPDDEVLVVDQDLHRVFRFATDGTLVQSIGSGLPVLDAPFNNPTGVAMDQRGRLFVSDGDSNTRVHVFSPSGEHLASWGTPGHGVGQITSPHSIALDAEGCVYIGDRDAARVIVFSPEGDHLREWSDVLHRPTSLWFDPDGSLWVADLVVRVHQYDTQGNVLSRAHAALPIHSITGDRHGNLFLVGDLPNVEKWERLETGEAESLVPDVDFSNVEVVVP